MSKLIFTKQADHDLTTLEQNKGLTKRLKAVRKALGYLEIRSRFKITHGVRVILKRPLMSVRSPNDQVILSQRRNPRHQGLNTHEYASLIGANGEKVFEAYAENKTSAAYRIFWHYGPGKDAITIIAITPHP